MGQGSSYDQLHRNIVIRADIYGGANSAPRILAKGLAQAGLAQGRRGFLQRGLP
jgi:hypothetical protein